MKITRNQFQRLTLIAALVASAILGSGCASDPLTKQFRKYGYAAAVPAPTTAYIGDIYEQANLRHNPDVQMQAPGMFTPEELTAMMNRLRDSVVVPDSSGEKSFKVSFNADIVGKAKVELEAHNIAKFRVIFHDMHRYQISKFDFEKNLLPQIKAKVAGRPLENKFTVVALLQVGALEYEFLNERGGKVAVEPGTALEKVLKARLGAEWSANEQRNLSITSPKFIGYRLARLTDDSFKVHGLMGTGGGGSEVREIPLNDLRKAAE